MQNKTARNKNKNFQFSRIELFIWIILNQFSAINDTINPSSYFWEIVLTNESIKNYGSFLTVK